MHASEYSSSTRTNTNTHDLFFSFFFFYFVYVFECPSAALLSAVHNTTTDSSVCLSIGDKYSRRRCGCQINKENPEPPTRFSLSLPFAVSLSLSIQICTNNSRQERVVQTQTNTQTPQTQRTGGQRAELRLVPLFLCFSLGFCLGTEPLSAN